MKILIDMNLTPQWVTVFEKAGIESVHWSKIGSHDASDRKIMEYAREHGYIIFTHDLDFGNMLAATGAESPSVIQVRTQDPTPKALSSELLLTIERFHSYLEEGSLITIDLSKSRVRILPFKRLDA